MSTRMVQFNYSSKSSLTFKFEEGMVKFMNKADGDVASKKEVLEKMANDYSIRIIETADVTEDHVGFERLSHCCVSFM